MNETNETNENNEVYSAEHYHQMKTETILVMEDFVENANNLTEKQKLNCAQALKYILRAGFKGNAEKDLRKAENYIHRAISGDWIGKD